MSAATKESFDVLIEIPKGSRNKYEYDFDIKKIRYDRMIFSSMMYPADYGFIPETLALDGDPLDVLVLGPAVPRGRVVQVKIIGVLKLLDRGEQDDKLIAVLKGSHFYSINNLVMLEDQFVGVTEIIKIWFANYKGPNKMKVLGLEDKPVADKILNSAIAAYPKK